MKLSRHDAEEVQRSIWTKFMDELEFNITDDEEYAAYTDLFDNFIEPKITEAIEDYLKETK